MGKQSFIGQEGSGQVGCFAHFAVQARPGNPAMMSGMFWLLPVDLGP
jgi:hypothetical protein